MIGPLLSMLLAASGQAGWATYHNDRYGFSVCYPSTALHAQREADNGDGRKFTALDGAELTTYAANDVSNGGYQSELASFESDVLKQRGSITYRAHGSNWGVISGVSNAKIFYVKAISRGDQVVVFDFAYPATMKAKYSPLAAKLVACFRAGTAPF